MKSCLFRYIASVVHKPESSLVGHSAEWESWCVYRLLVDMGYQVDVLNWKGKVNIVKTYDVVFDVVDLSELSAAFRDDTIKIFHLTGADNKWRNEHGERRLKALNKRRGCNLGYVRRIGEPERVYQNIELADFATLIGNEWTLSTYPERYRDKIRLVNVSRSEIG